MRTLLAVFAIVVGVIATTVLVADTRIERAFQLARVRGERDREVAVTADRVLRLAIDKETGQRGFLITADPSFLTPYDAASAALPTELARLRALVEPESYPIVDEIATLVDRWDRETGYPGIDARRRLEAGLPAPSEAVGPQAAAKGKQLVDAIRGAHARLTELAAADRLRLSAALESYRWTTRLVVLGALALVGFMTLAISLLATLRLMRGARRAIEVSEAIARRNFATPVPALPGALARLGASLSATSAALREQERQADALLEIGRLVVDPHLDALAAEVGRIAGRIVPLASTSLIVADTAPPELREPLARAADSGVRVWEIGGAVHVVVPLSRRGDEPSAVDFALDPGTRPSHDQLRFLEVLASQTAALVHSSRLTALLAERNAELERASRTKSEFLARMSHELRTPLNAIIGFSEVLHDETFGPLNPRQGHYVRNVHEAGNHLLALINDLLDLAKIEAERLELSVESCDLAAIAHDVVGSVRLLAEAKQLRLELQVDPATGLVDGDPRRLKQVLYNLLSNAIKFTPDGGRVSVTIAPHAEQIRLSIADTGIGISKDETAKLFLPFSQLGAARTNASGTGLGLVLVRQLVEIMGGSISLESEPGKGSTFHVYLARAGESRPVPPQAPLASASSGGGPLVLIVEDDRAARELLELTLGQAGYRTVAVSTGEEALAIARRMRPDAITLDVHLPAIDGWEVLRALRGDDATTQIPVFLISVSDDRKKSSSLGAVEHLVKPLERAALLAALERCNLTVAAKQRPVRVLAVDDDPLHLDLVRAVLVPQGFEVTVAATGNEGIDQARRGGFDVLLLDVMLPDVSGIEVVEALRSDTRTSTLPIVLVTSGEVSIADRRRVNGAVYAILAKTELAADRLADEIRRVLRSAS